MKTAAFLLTILLLVQPAAAERDVPFLSGRVNDNAGILSSETKAELEQLLKQHEDSTSNQIAVLTVEDLRGEALEQYSLKVAETWALGQKDKDNGVLFLISRDDRKIRIEVGSGLEGDLTDATAGRIIRHEIVPHFRDGDFDGGVRAGVVAILAAIDGAYAAEEDERTDDELIARLIGGLIFLVVVGAFTLIALLSTGFASWFLFFFLIPFWITFPLWFFNLPLGVVPFIIYFFGFIIAKVFMAKSDAGKKLAKRFAVTGGSGWSSRSGSFSSGGFSGSSFSGGGGSFSGGGSSGSW